MKATVLINGKPIMGCEPVTASFECGAKPVLVWQFKGANINGCYDLKVDGEIVEPWIVGQTGEIELASGETIEFIAVRKEPRQ